MLVFAGLTGSVTMITCTVLALTRLVFEYKGRPAECPLLPVGTCVLMDWIQFEALSPHRLDRGGYHGAAAAQHLSAADISHQRDSQSCSGLHQSYPLHHGPEDTGFTCHRHGVYCTILSRIEGDPALI